MNRRDFLAMIAATPMTALTPWYTSLRDGTWTPVYGLTLNQPRYFSPPVQYVKIGHIVEIRDTRSAPENQRRASHSTSSSADARRTG